METTTSNAANFTHLPDSVFSIVLRHYEGLGKIAPARRWIWAFAQAGFNRYDGAHVQALANTAAGRSNLVPNPFQAKA